MAQRVELMKLELDAKVRIETAKANALGTTLSAMNFKLISDPTAAASLLRMVTLADGIGEVVKGARGPVREIGQQLINKATGNPKGDALLRMSDTKGNGGGVAELAAMLPHLIKLAETHLDVNNLKGQSVGQVLHTLSERAPDSEQAMIAQATEALAALPIINDMAFDEVYLRASK